MSMKFVKRLFQKMSEGDDGQDEAERDQRCPRPQAENHQRAGNQFDKWNRDTDGPKRPHRQEGVGEWQKVFSRVLERTELKDFPEAGHEKDQAQHQPRE